MDGGLVSLRLLQLKEIRNNFSPKNRAAFEIESGPKNDLEKSKLGLAIFSEYYKARNNTLKDIKFAFYKKHALFKGPSPSFKEY